MSTIAASSKRGDATCSKETGEILNLETTLLS